MLKSPWIRKPEYPSVGQLDYDEKWKSIPRGIHPTLKSREKIMLKHIPSGSTVLSAGCGTSRLPSALKEKGCKVVAADIADSLLALQASAGITTMKLDLESKSSIDTLGQYDYIILSEVLEHLRFPEDALATLGDHGEHFIITIPNSAAYVFRYGLMFRGRFFTQWTTHPSEHLRYWSHIDFLDWLAAMGHTVEEVHVADGFTLKGLIPSLPTYWKNFLGYRMVYITHVQKNES